MKTPGPSNEARWGKLQKSYEKDVEDGREAGYVDGQKWAKDFASLGDLVEMIEGHTRPRILAGDYFDDREFNLVGKRICKQAFEEGYWEQFVEGATLVYEQDILPTLGEV